jgi:membrane-bound lytic murein transglycosylase A
LLALHCADHHAIHPMPYTNDWTTTMLTRPLMLSLAALLSCSAIAQTPASTSPEALALRAFQRSCPRLPADWQSVCQRAASTPTEAAAQFFASEFEPRRLQSPTGEGLLTAYFEPIINASTTPTAKLNTPIHARPDDLISGQAWASRTEIETGKASGLQTKVLVYSDRFDAFLLGVQGSGRVRLPDGKIEKLIYAGKNGHAYTSVGKVLVNAGEIPAEQISVPAIRTWLAQHPDKTDWLLRQNASYVFFARDDRATQTDGPPGAMALAEGLTPGYSVAVDPDTIPLGTPLLLSSSWPDGSPFQRIVVAQDKGGAIKGVVRADLFLGAGEEAEHTAGLMKQAAQITVLWPRGLALSAGLTAYIRSN